MITRVLESTVKEARALGLLGEDRATLKGCDHNMAAQTAANTPGCGDLFHTLVQEHDSLTSSPHTTIMIHPGRLKELMFGVNIIAYICSITTK